MELEKKIASFEKVKKNLLVKEVIFSDNNYECEIYDPVLKTTFWPFLQVSDKKEILDIFCSCKTYENKNFCEHLFLAYKKIIAKGEPIHVRFKNSFWYAIFKLLATQVGFNKKIIKKKLGSYCFLSDDQKELFSIVAKKDNIKRLQSYLFEKQFNQKLNPSVSFNEMKLMNENRLSFQHKYELSYFVDLAKWFFLMQENKIEYKVEFLEKKDLFFSKIFISFPNLEAKFYIPFENMNEIIPTLNTIKSPLKLFEYKAQEVLSIIYDRENKSFLIQKTQIKKAQSEQQKGIKIGDYIYIEDVGFYPLVLDELSKLDIIQKDEIPSFLTKYINIFEKKLENEKITKDKVMPKYYLYFDENENLNINLYIFEKDDFEKPFSTFFDSWVYIQDKGFFLLEEKIFDRPKTIILKENVSDFVNGHRTFLHNFEGFQTHFGSIESHLAYSFTKDEQLTFLAKLDFPEEFKHFIDFDDWIYIENMGFFSKKERKLTVSIRPGLTIKKQDISKFIETHREELEEVQNFFMDFDPIEKIGLNIFLNDDKKIHLKPEIKFKEEFKNFKTYFYDKYIYFEKVGFYEIPLNLALPLRYEKEIILTNAEADFFITYELDRLKPFIINIDNRLKKPLSLNLKILKIIKKIRKSKVNWYIELFYESEIGKVKASEVYEMLNENKKIFFSEAGLILLKLPRFNWLKNLDISKIDFKNNLLQLSTLDIVRLFLFENVKITKSYSKDAILTRKLLNELKTFDTEKSFNLSLLKASLRNYQQTGIKWLWFLYVNNLSGLLCDEMGLGKTHQSMALIAAAYFENPSKYLIVCPTSVIYHWEELLRIFLPSLKVNVYHGLEREESLENIDILLTSYGILRSEINKLKKIKFDVAIFDELQIAKNINSLTNKSLRLINANMRLGLTGTPIENYLIEIKAIFDIILPTYLPQESVFKDFFVIPIEKENDSERRKLLKKLINPFILRRLKKDVLLDLPEKIEEVVYTDLSKEQKMIYNDLINNSKDVILKDLKDEKKPVPYVHIFSLLAKLKQACDHPSLILKDLSTYYKHESGKFELLIELLNESKESSEKVVIFSQYLNMIAIISDYLKKNHIGFAQVTGITKKRFQEIKRFKEDPTCHVFLASLLAAGVGIDLSQASIVIHYDRWWNPAKENQATDRVHRIGQKRGVQVFKLVAKNTIEERIHFIIERKKSLISETIGKDEVDQIKTLSRQDLIEILTQIQT